MEKEIVNKKLKMSALILNIFMVAALIFMEAVAYDIVSYKDYLLLDYVPIKYIVFGEILFIVFIIIPFVIRIGKRGNIASIVISAILIISMITVGVLGIVYNVQLKNIFGKADTTIDEIVENSQLATDEYGVYVLKENRAEQLSDAKEYHYGYNKQFSSEDTETVISAIETELEAVIQKSEHTDPSLLAQKLFNKEVDAVILNQSLIDAITSAGDDTDDGKSNGTYADFTDKVKCIYTINVTKALETMKDEADVTKKCFNVYISGIDTNGDVTAKSRSDVNIIMSVNPVTGKIILISTPRDYYVPLSISNGVRDKLTHAGNYGIDVSMATLEMLYDMKFDYYLRMNFTGFIDIIDALGGIDVDSDYSFSTHGYSYTEGINKNLSGIEALWFARERHAFAEGDRQRGKDQMKVIEAVIKKCQSTALLENYDEILKNISKSFQTNMTKKTIKSLVRFQLNKAPNWEVITYSVGGRGTSDYTYSVPSQRAYVMVPDESTIEIAKGLLNDNMANKEIQNPKTTETENNE